ncbi:hypothetical protein MC7420_2891 [Coleofasciculus chthonoplastes PCC 7420]|uniref:Uncharacterized protein n=1 Tax=Coleofasciculus chthonoplastes PCC 7420 TaxID=118168 RepID=B4VJR6_9CYAN|nr:hypothetical protein [Coleofasciculus chthonoplastes]EDX77567.1 hypothetical protein MC7420_2891 [Coleofasciculus chthonoplastes PCC 7420]
MSSHEHLLKKGFSKPNSTPVPNPFKIQRRRVKALSPNLSPKEKLQLKQQADQISQLGYNSLNIPIKAPDPPTTQAIPSQPNSGEVTNQPTTPAADAVNIQADGLDDLDDQEETNERDEISLASASDGSASDGSIQRQEISDSEAEEIAEPQVNRVKNQEEETEIQPKTKQPARNFLELPINAPGASPSSIQRQGNLGEFGNSIQQQPVETEEKVEPEAEQELQEEDETIQRQEMPDSEAEAIPESEVDSIENPEEEPDIQAKVEQPKHNLSELLANASSTPPSSIQRQDDLGESGNPIQQQLVENEEKLEPEAKQEPPELDETIQHQEIPDAEEDEILSSEPQTVQRQSETPDIPDQEKEKSEDYHNFLEIPINVPGTPSSSIQRQVNFGRLSNQVVQPIKPTSNPGLNRLNTFKSQRINSPVNPVNPVLNQSSSHTVERQESSTEEKISRKVTTSEEFRPVKEGEQEEDNKPDTSVSEEVPSEEETTEVSSTKSTLTTNTHNDNKNTSNKSQEKPSKALNEQEQPETESKPESETTTGSDAQEVELAVEEAKTELGAKVTEPAQGSKDSEIAQADTAKEEATQQNKSTEESTEAVAVDNEANPETVAGEDTTQGDLDSQQTEQTEKVAQTAQAESAVAETSTQMEAAQSNVEQLPTAQPNFVPSQPKAMFLTTEDNSATVGAENVLGSVGDGVVLFQTNNPEQFQTDENGGGLVQQIPASGVAAIEEGKQQESQAALAQFMSDGATSVSQVTDAGQTIQPRIQEATTQAQALIDAAIQQNQTTVANAIAQARAKAKTQATEAQNQLKTQYKATESAIKQATADARERIETEHTTSLESLTRLQTDMVEAVNNCFATAEINARALGTTLGGEAIAKGQARSQQYSQEPLPETSGWDDFWDGEDYHKNRRKAKEDAALQVGQAYNEELVTKANESADQLIANKSSVLEGVQTKIEETRAQIEAKHTAALTELDQAESSSLLAANKTLQSQSQAVEQALSQTLASLDQLKTTQLEQVNQVGEQQKLAIHQTEQQSIAALQQGVSEAAASVEATLQQMASEASGVECPNPEALKATLANAREQLNYVVAEAQNTVETGITESSQGILEQSQQAIQSLDEVGQQTSELSEQVLGDFSTSLTQVTDSASQVFTDLQNKHTETVRGTADRVVEELKGLINDVDQAFKTVGENLKTELENSVTQLETDLRSSLSELDSKITEEADKAADKVQPAWKGWVKIIIDIAIAIVVTAAIVALASTGIGLLATIGLAALIGAAGGVTKQLLHDAVDGEISSKEVYFREAVLGAVAGVITLAGAGAGNAASSFIGKQLLAKGITNQVLTKAATMGAEVVVGTVIDTVGAGLTDTLKRAMSGEEFSLETAFQAMYGSVGVNFLGNLGGTILAPYLGGFYSKTGLGGATTKEVGQQVTREVTEEVTEQVTKEVSQEVTEQVTKEVGEEVSAQVTKEVAEEVTEQVTKEVTEEVTQQVTKEVTEEATEQTVKEVTQETTEQVTKDITEETTEKATKQATGETAEQTTKEVTEEATGETTEQATKTIKTDETPNGRSSHTGEPQVEPGVVAKQKAADGHEIKVLEDGRVVRCSDCGEIRTQYANELADPKNSHLKSQLDEVEAIPDPDLKAKQAAELEQELANIRRRTAQIEESRKRFDNFREPVDPKDIKGAQPVEGSGTAGHARSKHGVSNQTQAEILNNPERIFSGRNKNGREVDIYYKDGSIVITEAGRKNSVITAYGSVSSKGNATPVDPQKWAGDSSYVEIKVEGSNEVIYPNPDRFNLDDWP